MHNFTKIDTDAVGSCTMVESSLLSSIRQTQVAVELVLNNRFQEAQQSLEGERKTSMYHALGYATILYLRAGITFDRAEFNSALQAISEALQVVHSKRRGWSFFRSATSQSTIDSLSMEQMHAELCYAELLLEQSMITMMLNESNIFRVFGALLAIKDALSTYKYCYTILTKRHWKLPTSNAASNGATETKSTELTQEMSDSGAVDEETLLKEHFESGVRLGLGAFNVLLSALPDVAMRMLALVGISGKRRFGFEQMKIASEMQNGETIRGILASIALLAFHLVVAYSFGTADGDLDWCERTLNRLLLRFDRCAIFLYFSGRLQLVRGCVVEAADTLRRAIEAQSEWKELHFACRWEMMWCAAFEANWLEAYRHASCLQRGCSWSKCLFSYCCAVFLYQYRASGNKPEAESVTDGDVNEEEEKDVKSQIRQLVQDGNALDKRIEELFASVPASMQRVAGKHLPLEKLAESRAKCYVSSDKKPESLVLPALEIIYVFCGIPMLANNEALLGKFLSTVEIELRTRQLPLASDTLEQCALQRTDRYSIDDACMLYLFKAACLSNRQQSTQSLATDRQATKIFLDTVIRHEQASKSAGEYEVYLYPCAKVELALLLLKHREAAESESESESLIKEAIQLLESAENDHPKYYLRSRVHVRIRSLINSLKPQLEQLINRRSSVQSADKVDLQNSCEDHRVKASVSMNFAAYDHDKQID